MKLDNFYNDGFGWICRRCEREFEKQSETEKHFRIWREGEAESKNPRFANPAVARWADDTRRVLMCPRCNITEVADKS